MISDRNYFSYFFFLFFFFFFFFFLSASHPDASYQLSSQVAFQLKKKKLKIDFNDGAHLGLSIGTILAVFDVQGNQMLPSYQVSSRLAFCFGRRSNKIDFQDGGHGMLISDWNCFNFLIQDSNQLTFQFRRRTEKQTFKIVFTAASLDCRSERFLANFALQDTPVLPT